MLDARSEAILGKLSEAIRTAFGADLLSLILYGSAAGQDFVSGRSDLNFAIVLEQIQFSHLRILHQQLPAWSKQGMAMPLLFDRAFLESAADVFPMELLDIQAQHRVLYGDELIATLRVDARHLHYQSEHEARSKLLRLRAMFIEVGADRKRLQELMLASSKTFVIIMRSLLRLRSSAAPVGYQEVIAAYERQFQRRFPTLQSVIRLRSDGAGWPDDIEQLFSAYLEEVERLVDSIDRAHADTDSRSNSKT